jgi:transketolase
VLDLARPPEIALGKPRVILAHTVKGRGVPFMEANDAWHAGHLTKEQYEAAMQEVSR